MRPLLLSLLLSSVWGYGVLAAPPDLKLTLDKPKPVTGDLVKVSADTTAKAIRWKVIGDFQHVADSSGRAVYVVVKSGKVSVIAIAASDTGELSEFAECVIAVEAEVVLTPLAKSIQTAMMDVSPEEKVLLPNLKTFYIKAAKTAVDPALLTWGDLTTKLLTISQEEGTAGKLKPIQVVISQTLSAELPSKNASSQLLDQPGRDKAVAVFSKVANAIGEVLK